MITRKLTKEEQSELLDVLFGFSFHNDILIDDDGQEFYATQSNSQFDFSTLAGFFSYQAHLSKRRGYSDCQRAVKKALGI